MSWFADIAGKAENLLKNFDEQTGVVLRNHNVIKPKKYDRHEFVQAEPAWGQRKRPIPRNLKKIPIETRPTYVPSRKSSPMSHNSPPVRDNHEYTGRSSPKSKKSPPKKLYTLNNAPRTLVGDMQDEIILNDYGLKHRRYSLPADLEGISSENLIYRMENLEVENAMLKNELNVINREVSGLLDRLRKTEDELSQTNLKLENTEVENDRIKVEKDTLMSQLAELKVQIENISFVEIKNYKDKIQNLETDVTVLQSRNTEFEEMVKQLNDKTTENDSSKKKLENELRHAQSTINDLHADLDRSNSECKRLEKDWETYKHRVKSMLGAKDKEIKALQEGLNLTEDTKILVEQIDNLKEEREVLSEAITRVRGECEDMKQYMGTLESRHTAAERVVVALRDALKDERAARNRAEAQCSAMTKELKSIQIETGQTIASLRTALRDKEHELNRARESISTVRTTDTSALNVADYDVSRDSIDNEQLYHLTQKLIVKQGKIDSLLADNNILRIQLEKLEARFKAELQTHRGKNHSVVHVQEGDRVRSRFTNVDDSPMSKLSRRIGLMIRRYPIIRIFIIVYMICLHFWVLTVLFTSTPETYVTRPSYQL